MGRVSGLCRILLFAATVLLLASAFAQDERVLCHAQVFTADPQNPYADAVAIRAGKIVAVGNLPEVLKSVSPNAERIDLQGKSLFPGFIDSHSHSIEGGLSLIAADATDKVHSVSELPPFVDEARKSGRGMRGDIVEVQGLPLEIWSHPDVLNQD